ncbi:MAG: hypothetical protein K0U42_03115 [Actinomycetia bacterium]|nr:hypothetical protein [Actinomycetes bacterium]
MTSDHMAVRNLLLEIQRNGGPAQVESATKLLDQLAVQSDISEQARMLYEAYVNDPYLTRNG